MGQAQWKYDIARSIWECVLDGDVDDVPMPSEAYAAAAAMMEHVPIGSTEDAAEYVRRAITTGQLKATLEGDVFEWEVVPSRENPVKVTERDYAGVKHERIDSGDLPRAIRRADPFQQRERERLPPRERERLPPRENPTTTIPFRWLGCGTRLCEFLVYLPRTELIYRYEYQRRGNEWIPEIYGAWKADGPGDLDDVNDRGEPPGDFVGRHNFPYPNTREATAIKAQALEVIDLKTNPAHAEDLHDNWSGSDVQSLLFDRDLFSATRAREWAKSHGFKYGSIDTTERYHHLRQQEPDGRTCRTISFGESGIKAVVCARSNPIAFKTIEARDARKGMRYRESPVYDHTIKIVGVSQEDRVFPVEIRLEDGQVLHFRHNFRIEVVDEAKKNPVGDQVHVIGGPARGRRGIVEHETEHVARVRFAEGGRGHVERGHLEARKRR